MLAFLVTHGVMLVRTVKRLFMQLIKSVVVVSDPELKLLKRLLDLSNLSLLIDEVG